MREIKFRAWSVIEGFIYFTLDELIRNVINRQHLIDYPHLPKMQYTGLKDKNGKEIYEGDILKSVAGKGEVIFYDGSFMGQYENEDFVLNLQEVYYRKLEIIGNIYENKELLS